MKDELIKSNYKFVIYLLWLTVEINSSVGEF